MSTSGKEQQALVALLKRSCVDYEFRRQLLVDPRRAIREAIGVIIPMDFHVKFIEKDEGVDALVVLPDFHRQDRELSDGDLRPVAGGGAGRPPEANWAEGIGNSKPRVARATGRGQRRVVVGRITRA
jgi:hypothetical protein